MRIKKYLILVVIQLSQTIIDASKKIVVGKMKDKTADFSIEELVGLKPKLYSFSANDSSEYKKTKVVNKNVITTISLTKFRYAFL